MNLSDCTPAERAALQALAQRIGAALLERRLQREGHRAPAPRLSHRLIRAGLTLSGLRARGRRNVLDIQLRHNTVWLDRFPAAFDGFTLLHLSDPHLDMDAEFLRHLIARVQGLDFDACVLTGDFRFHGHGSFAAVLDGLQALRPHLGERVYSVLGNHDSIRMVPGMEERGYRVLMNEAVQLRRGAESITVAGIDDAHFFRTHDLDQALAGVVPQSFIVLLSHTPEPYAQAAAAGVAADAQRPHARRPDLPARRNPDTDRYASAALGRARRLALPAHGRLYLCRLRLFSDRCAAQLSAGDYLASLAPTSGYDAEKSVTRWHASALLAAHVAHEPTSDR